MADLNPLSVDWPQILDRLDEPSGGGGGVTVEDHGTYLTITFPDVEGGE